MQADQTMRADQQVSITEPGSGSQPGHAVTAHPAGRRVDRRAFLGLALAGLVVTACRKEQVVYVDAPTPTAQPAPAAAPTVAPTAAPKPAAQPAVKPATRPASQGPIPLPVPVVSGPVAAIAAQSQVIPPLQPRSRPYVNRLQPPERLQIPGVDLDAKVVPVGTKTDDQGRILWETAAFAVGHHKGSGLPGESGNIVLSGHISSPREGAIFSKLPQVAPGDGVVLSTSDRQYLYVVVDTKVVTPDAVEVLDSSDQAIVTMITCVPDGIYSHRLVVRAEAV
jgi:LPXTG-site transpeptidase (sortase) family protein